jgi:hypothetical protein
MRINVAFNSYNLETAATYIIGHIDFTAEAS